MTSVPTGISYLTNMVSLNIVHSFIEISICKHESMDLGPGSLKEFPPGITYMTKMTAIYTNIIHIF